MRKTPPVRRLSARFLRDESGATAVEYAILLACIFLAIIGAVQAFGQNATKVFTDASAAIVGASGGGGAS